MKTGDSAIGGRSSDARHRIAAAASPDRRGSLDLPQSGQNQSAALPKTGQSTISAYSEPRLRFMDQDFQSSASPSPLMSVHFHTILSRE
jgi:hypothetical protein